MSETYVTTMQTPVGELTLTATAEGLTGVLFETQRHTPSADAMAAWRHDDGSAGRASDVLRQARRQLEEYFAGARTTFELPLAPEGTEFQRSVWTALRSIGYGKTVSYGEIAERIGSPKAVRAVGAANGRNPLPIVVPCHRVVGSDGSLTGFGGGMERKEWLLTHERALTPRAPGQARPARVRVSALPELAASHSP